MPHATRPSQTLAGQPTPQATVTVRDLAAALSTLDPGLEVFLDDGRGFAARLSAELVLGDYDEMGDGSGEFLTDATGPDRALFLVPTARLGADYEPDDAQEEGDTE